MYLQSHFEETRIDVLHELVRAHPLATFVTAMHDAITVNHMPFLISTDGGAYGMLKGHIPRANPVWRALDGNLEAVAVFQGAESYISPSWYPSKHAHGKAVPTWNYAVVHARGRPRYGGTEDGTIVVILGHLVRRTQQDVPEARVFRLSLSRSVPRASSVRLIWAPSGSIRIGMCGRRRAGDSPRGPC